ncbi:hypothetical protein U1Q18_009991, partial [Sarracenia purpurea var. burkii]
MGGRRRLEGFVGVDRGFVVYESKKKKKKGRLRTTKLVCRWSLVASRRLTRVRDDKR